MRILFILFLLLAQKIGQTQNIIFEKGYDTLIALNVDTTYKVPFSVKGTTIGGIPKIKISPSTQSTALKDIDFILLENDSVKAENLTINARNYSGTFLLSIRGNLDVKKNIAFDILIDDNGKVAKSSIPIYFKTYIKPGKPKEPEKKDSIMISLYKDIDILVYGKTDCLNKKQKRKENRQNKKRRKESEKMENVIVTPQAPHCFVNINKVTIEENGAGKYYITVYTTEGERYQNPEAIEIKEKWSDDEKIFLNGGKKSGDKDSSSIKLNDFLELTIERKNIPVKTLTPQNRIIKIEEKNSLKNEKTF